MDRFAVMVDAGYFLRQSVEIVSRRASSKRGELEITDPEGLFRLLIEESKSALGLTSRELLRVYWYDGLLPTGLTPQQRSIVQLPDVSFRAGTVNSKRQQKGVDSLIITDLIELAANHAVCDAALITGDGDLAIGIELAQKKGVRVALLGVEDLSIGVSHHQSFEVTSRADRVSRIGLASLSPVMRHQAPIAQSTPTIVAPIAASAVAAPVATPVTEPQRVLDDVQKTRITEAVKAFCNAQTTLSGSVDPGTKRIDATVDRALLHHVFEVLAVGKLTNDERVFARQRLRSELGM